MAEIKSGLDATLLTVDPISKAARSSLYDPSGQSAVMAAQDQPITLAGVMQLGANDRSAVPLRVDRLGSQAVALHTPLLFESFEGTVPHATRWNVIATTMAATMTTVGGLVLNSGASAAINVGYLLQSTQRFTKTQRMPLQVKMRARLNRATNSVMELGFGDAATFNGAHTTGAYWQVQSGGAVKPVLTFNGVDSTGGVDISGLLNLVDYYTFDVWMDDDEATFTVQNTATGLILNRQTIPLPAPQQRLLSATALPVIARLYNTGTAPASAPQMIVTDVMVLALDGSLNRPWSATCAAQGRASIENPFTGAQLANNTNNTTPVNATLSNATAGYTTLGGLFSFIPLAGAVTDYALFGFQVPVGANFRMTDIAIETWNTGAAVATTPTLLVWSLATNLTAVSLATANHQRRALGAQSLPIGAVPGAKAERIAQTFDTPVACHGGRFIDIILRMPVGTATASQVVQGMVNVGGYFE
jgi:hypothetical protein